MADDNQQPAVPAENFQQPRPFNPPRQRPLASGLMPGDIDWLERVLPVLVPQAQRIMDLLRRHEGDFMLDAEEREKKLHAQWEAWEREAQNRHCIVCTEIMWTQDMSGKNNVICMGCGRSMCITHYLVHKALESGYLSPEQQLQGMREASQRLYHTTDWQSLSIAQRASLSLTVELPQGRNLQPTTYTIYAGEYEQHWKHRCRAPIPHKDMNVLRVEQAIHQAELIRIDKEMESAPAEVERPAAPRPKCSSNETICPQCSGSGAAYIRADGHETPQCSNCHGTGKVHTCTSCAKYVGCGCGPCTGWKP